MSRFTPKGGLRLFSFVVATLCLVLAACKKTPPAQTVELGSLRAEEWSEQDQEGLLLKCYLLGKESNKPVHICGEGGPAPDRKTYLIEAKTPKPGRFTEEVGTPLPPGFYLLRELSQNRIEAWSLGRLGARQWLGGGKRLLAASQTGRGTTRVRLLDAADREEQAFDVPLTLTEGYVTIASPDESALLLVQKIGGELLILVHAPLGNAYVETLDLPHATTPGGKKLWRRGSPARARHEVFHVDAVLTSGVSWKGEEPYFEDERLGPFEPLADAPEAR